APGKGYGNLRPDLEAGPVNLLSTDQARNVGVKSPTADLEGCGCGPWIDGSGVVPVTAPSQPIVAVAVPKNIALFLPLLKHVANIPLPPRAIGAWGIRC